MAPKADKVKTVEADKVEQTGRLNKAKQFFQSAEELMELADEEGANADSVVTLFVHAGIAASDSICAVALGKYASGENHQDAIVLLATVDASASKWLGTLLGMKTRAGYGYDPISKMNLLKAERAARSLVDLASS